MLDVLLADDDKDVLESVSRALAEEGHQVTQAADGAAAAELLSSHRFDLAICDVQMPKLGGMSLLRRIRREAPNTVVVMMSAYAEIPDAVGSLRDGALDYVTKSFDPHDFAVNVVGRIAERRALEKRIDDGHSKLGAQATGPNLVAVSAPMRKLVGRIGVVASSDVPVVVTGDRGTGKELVARTIHAKGSRQDGPFVRIDGVELGDLLLACDPAGAHDAVNRRRDAWLRGALGGTLVLDGIEKLPLVAQAHLTRLLGTTGAQARRTPAGKPLGARLITVTRAPLDGASPSTMLDSLHHRLSGLRLHVPSLRERGADLLLLVNELLREVVAPRQPVPPISPDAWAALSRYSYPGNVRELRWMLEHAATMAEGMPIEAQHLPGEVTGSR
jgi:DNA-binding NtrC family response regulator